MSDQNVIHLQSRREEWTVDVTPPFGEASEIYCGATYLDALQAMINYAKRFPGATIQPGERDVWALQLRAGVAYHVTITGWLALD